MFHAPIVVLVLAALCSALSDEFRIVHLSDFHYDPLYKALSSDAKFCRSGTGTAGRFGTRNNCDTPLALVDATTAALVGLFRNESAMFTPSNSFVYWSGDAYAHQAVDLAGLYLSINTTMRAVLSAGFRPLSVIPCLGNHDTVPPDALSSQDPVFSAVGAIFQALGVMTAQEVAVFSRGGYFSRTLTTPAGSTVLAISLNTILWYSANPYAQQGVDDAGQMVFLEAELARARAARSIVHIICHVPPGYQSETGNPLLVPAFNDRFLFLLEDYKDVAKAVFAGHEHKDTTRLLANRLYTGFLEIPVFVAPSITPNSKSAVADNNPGVRLYRARLPSTFDYAQDFLSLEAANALPLSAAPAFAQEYRASEAYGFAGQGTFSDWAALVRGMAASTETKPAGAWLTYITYKYVSSQASPTQCTTAKCIATNLCAMVCGRMDGHFDVCLNNPSATINALALPTPTPSATPTPAAHPEISLQPSVQATPSAAVSAAAAATRTWGGRMIAAVAIALAVGLAGIVSLAALIIINNKKKQATPPPMEALPELQPNV